MRSLEMFTASDILDSFNRWFYHHIMHFFFNNFGLGADLGDQDDIREPILWKMEDSSSVQLEKRY